MDFSKLVQDDFTPEWCKEIIRNLSPYPYLADILVILSAFAVGAIISMLLYLPAAFSASFLSAALQNEPGASFLHP